MKGFRISLAFLVNVVVFGKNLKLSSVMISFEGRSNEMKKSMAIILLGSALLLPNNIQAEAAYQPSDKTYPKKLSLHQVEGKAYQHVYDYQTLRQMECKPFLYKLNNRTEKPKRPVVQEPKQGSVQKPVDEPKSAPQPSEQQAPVKTPTTPVENNQHPAPSTSVKDPAPAPQVQQGISVVEQAVLDVTNKERQKAGLSPLQVDTKLMNSARQKSADMAKNRYFSHTSPTYGSPFDQMKANGISYRSAAENIAMGQRTAAEVVQAWMDSPGHRQNILTAEFTHIGIGYDANGHYWTQQFITK